MAKSVIDRAVGNSPPPLDDVGGIDAAVFDENDPNRPRELAPPDSGGDEVAPTPSPMDALIERWFADHFFGSAVARDTQAWNAAHAAKEALKLLLKGA